jgi:hypothetical protein
MLPVLPVLLVILAGHAEPKTEAAALGKTSDNAPAFWTAAPLRRPAKVMTWTVTLKKGICSVISQSKFQGNMIFADLLNIYLICQLIENDF